MHPLYDPITIEGVVVSTPIQNVQGLRIEIRENSMSDDEFPLATSWTNFEGSFACDISPQDLIAIYGSDDIVLKCEVYHDDTIIEIQKGNAHWQYGQSQSPLELSINLPLDFVVNAGYEVHGTLYNIEMQPLSSMVVKAYNRVLSSEGLFDVEVGWAISDASGYYKIIFSLPEEEFSNHINPDLVVRAFDSYDFNENNPLCESDCLKQAPLTSEIDLISPVCVQSAISEFEKVSILTRNSNRNESNFIEEYQNDYESILEDYAELEPQDAAMIESFLDSTQMSKETELPPQLFFALINEGISPHPFELVQFTSSDWEEALQTSAENNIIPDVLSECERKQLIEHLQQVLTTWHSESGDAEEPTLYDILSISDVDPLHKKSIIRNFISRDCDESSFWNESINNIEGLDSATIDMCRLCILFDEFTERNIPLMKQLFALKKEGTIDQIQDLVLFTECQWEDFISKFSSIQKGDNESIESVNSSISEMRAKLDKRFPDDTLRREFIKDSDFDETIKHVLQKTIGKPIDSIQIHNELSLYKESLSENNSDQLEIANAFEGIQRTFRIAKNPKSVKELLLHGIDSAWSVARTPQERFIEIFSPVLGFEEAAAIHNAAQQSANSTQNAFIQARQATQQMPFAIGGTPAAQQKAVNSAVKNVADAHSLFGMETLCKCEHSRSVYSPAAYLVDLLDLLDFGSAAKKKQRQFTGGKRRMWNWKPSKGENPIDILLARRQDIAHILLTPQNTKTPLPYIDLVNEILEAFITKSSAAFDTGDISADILRSIPQNVNHQAYEIISNSLYPMSLPFHRPLETMRIFLKHLGVNRLEMMQAVLKKKSDKAYILAETLRVSPSELSLLTTQHSEPWVLFGLPQKLPDNNTWTGILSFAPNFIQRTGVCYEDIIALAQTRFLSRNKIKIEQDTPSCDVNKIRISGADSAWFELTARFLRLQKKLNLSIQDLDTCLSSINATNITLDTIEKIVTVKEIAEILKKSIVETTTLWSNIETLKDNSLYKKLFLNSMVSWSSNDKKSFELNESKLEVAVPQEDITIHSSAIQAAFQITDSDFRVILDSLHTQGIKITFNLEGLSIIYRYTLLTKSLHIHTTDLIRIISWIPADEIPFQAANPQTVKNFITLVKDIKNSSFKPETLDFLFLNRIVPPSNPGPTESTIFNTISSIRQRLIEVIAETELPSKITYNVFQNKLSLLFDSSIVKLALEVFNPGSKLPHKVRRDFLEKNFKKIFANIDQVLSDLYGTNESKNAVENEKNKTENIISEAFEYNINYVLRSLLPWLRQKKQHGAIIETLADTLGLKQNVVQFLISDHLQSSISSNKNSLYDYELLSGTGIQAHYYTTNDLSGKPVIQRIENSIDFKWSELQSDMQQDISSAQWQGYILPGEKKEYSFSIISDGIVTLSLQDNKKTHQLIDNNSPVNQNEFQSKPIALDPKEFYKITVTYRRTNNPGLLTLFWSTSPAAKKIVEPSYLFTSNGIQSFTPIIVSFIKLYKTSLFINGFELNKEEIEYFIKNSFKINFNDFGLSKSPYQTAKILLGHWKQIYTYITIRNGLPKSEKNLIDLFKIDTTFSKRLQELSDITGWDNEILHQLAGPNGFNLQNNDILPPINTSEPWKLAWLKEGVRITKQLGVATNKLIEWSRAVPDPDQVASVIQAVKQRYTRKEWLKIAQELFDPLREKQRDALVAYLIPRMTDKGITNKNHLFEYFLIDTEMSSCMMTSRVKQAISSIQLFIQRILLNLEEPHIHPSSVDSAEWKWLKNYRVWEANRKVFLYPENWIEPELRDDKSPLFQSLEKELLQAELTDSNVENAYRAYLRELDEISRLEIKGIWHQFSTGINKGRHKKSAINIYHVFGRTFSQPHRYFYRQFINGSKWSPWTSVDVDIQGNHLIPVIVSGRLTLFWLVLEEKSRPATTFNDPTKKKGKIDQPKRDWEIRLEFTELQSDNWLPKRISKGALRFPQFGPEKHFTARLRQVSPEGDVVIDVFFQIPDRSQVHQSQMLRIGQFIKEGCRGQIFALPEAMVQAQLAHAHLTQSMTGKVKLQGGQPFSHPRHTDINGMGFSGSSKSKRIVRTTTKRKKVGKKIKYIKSNSTITQKPTLNMHVGIGKGSNQVILNNLEGSGSQKNRSYEVLLPARMSYAQNPKPYPFIFQDTYNTFFVRVITRLVKYTRVLLFRKNKGPQNPRWRIRFKSRGLVKRTPSEEFVQLFSESNMDLFERKKKKRRHVRSKQKKHKILSKKTQKQKKQPIRYERKKVNSYKIDAQYHFINFQHPFVCSFIRDLNRGGIDSILRIKNQILTFDGNAKIQPNISAKQLRKNQELETFFFKTYRPGKNVHPPYPRMNVDFSFSGSYSIYNWELFFHIPLLIATRLTKEHKFEQAQKWFHYIFDPTSADTMPAPSRFWNFLPFKTNSELLRATQVMQLLAYTGNNSYIKILQRNVVLQIEEWAKNPFNPHAIARLRLVAFQKSVVMKYIDNLIDWADALFRKDTIESTNEATQLYILAANILGPRQKPIPPMTKPKPLSYSKMRSNLEIFSNFVVRFETQQIKAPFSIRGAADPNASSGSLLGLGTLYFCIPGNENLDKYWDTVEDRLFKLRNCMNIEGVVRQLPLFQPPIDPAMLVRAAAAGVDISTAIDGLNAPLPIYRFNIMLKQAQKFAKELQNTGLLLLRALERKDSHELAELEISQSSQLLKRIVTYRKQQVTEIEAERNALEEGLAGLEIEAAYLTEVSQKLENEFEKAEQDARREGIKNMAIAKGSQLIGKILRAIPNFKIGVVAIGPESTVQTGGQQLSDIALAAAEGALAVAASSQASAEMAAVNAQRHRVQQELQTKANQLVELKKQFEKQILAASIREQAAESRLQDAKFEYNQAKEKHEWLKNHFTSKQLYSWIVSELSSIYYRAYKLTSTIAQSAEQAWKFEHPDITTNFIQFTYWDSVKKGLLAAEHLIFDLQRLESKAMEGDKRLLELTKRVSLSRYFPMKFMQLKADGSCDFELLETFFDADHSGHYFRRIKTVSISIITEKVTALEANASLTLLNNKMRKEPVARGNYEAQNEDSRFMYNLIPIQKISTSKGKDDSGVFELQFNDNKYLPFEGAGAISKWRLELPQMSNEFPLYKMDDVILTMHYTAKDGGAPLAQSSRKYLKQQLKKTDGTHPLQHLINLQTMFSSQWNKICKNTGTQELFDFNVALFPARYCNNIIKIIGLDVFIYTNNSTITDMKMKISPPDKSAQILSNWTSYSKSKNWYRSHIDVNATAGEWKIGIENDNNAKANDIQNIQILFNLVLSDL